MKEKKVSEIPEKERRGILVKRPKREPLVSEEMSTEEKNERFEKKIRRLTKRR